MAQQTAWHNISWHDAVKQLNSDTERGLSGEEAFLRQKKFGKNQLAEEKPLPAFKILFNQLKSPLIYILAMAGLITLFLKEWDDAVIIFGTVILNTFFGFFQDNKAGKALSALKKMVKIEAHVIRDDSQININSADLAPGDIIVLTAGNKIPADARLIDCRHLKINESALTGEWLPAEKNEDVLSQDPPLADRDNMVYMGSVIEQGKGRAVVTAIGKDTEMGKVSKIVKEIREEKTPYQKKVMHLSKVIGLLIVLISLTIFVLGITAGREFSQMFLVAVAVAVAAIPEGLPVSLTVILALGMQRILKRRGLARKLVAAETLGSTSVIATDKTLTLTQGRMQVSEIFTEDRNLLYTIMVLTNEPSGGPTAKALLSAGTENGFLKTELEKVYFKLDEIPFNHQNKFLAVLVQFKKNGDEQMILVAGAPEKILSHSLLSENDLLRLNSKLEELAGKGLRVVAAACKKIINHKTEIKNLEKEIESLTFAGFIGLKDPLRPEAKEAFSACRKAGIRPVIVTGDHLLTAKAVAEELDLRTGNENIIEGKELDSISDISLQTRLKDIDVYARVEPRHKLRIIEAWQASGHVVAMTGDGINDSPALKRADIGVALGSGTDVAKEVSDLVLLTDNFNIIVAAVEEGRAIIDNIRKTVTLLVSQSFSEIVLIGISIMAGLPLPILPAQILWENLIEGGPQGIALAFEPKEKGVMARAPENPKSPLLTAQMKTIIFGFGIFTDLITFGLFLWLLKMEFPIDEIRTIIFSALAIDTFFFAFSCRNLRKNLWHYNPFSNHYLVLSIIFSFLALLLAVYLPPLQSLLKTVPLNSFAWLLLLGLGLLHLISIELVKFIFIIKHKNKEK